jgi:glycosyltransferase involved in cell wall biosynthesis
VKSKVLLIPELFPTDLASGSGVFMSDQLKALTRFADVTVYNTNPWYRGIYQQSHSARYFDFHLYSRKWNPPFNLLAYAWWERKSIELALKLPRPDIIHLHGAALRGGIATALADHWSVPIVITEHTGPWSAIASRKMVFRRAKSVMEKADILLPVSNHLKNEILQSGIQAKRVQVTGNPVDTELFSLRTNNLTAHRNMLFVGRLDEFKGGMRTLKAFHSICDKLPEWTLTIAGEGVEAEVILEFIYRHNLQDRVDFHRGFVSREDLPGFFHRASLLVFPSIFESFGLVGAEAMATGLPVVITNRTGPVDYFGEGCGIQIIPESEKSIADGMMQVVKNIDQYNPAFIRAQISERFSIDKYANTLDGVYRSIISVG